MKMIIIRIKEMKKFYLPAIMLLAVAGLVSCENDDEENYSTTSTTINKIAVDNSRLLSYYNGSTGMQSIKRRTVAQVAAPSIPADALNMFDLDGKGTQYQAWSAKTNTNYYIPSGKSWTSDIQLKNNTSYYIAGSLKLSGWGSGSTLYVLPGGSIELPATLDNGVTIESWGDVTFPSSLAINNNGSFTNYNAAKTMVIETINNQGTFATAGNVTAKSFQVSAKGKSTVDGDVDVEKDVTISNQSSLVTGGSVGCNYFELNTASSATIGTCLGVATTVSVNNNTNLTLTKCLHAQNINMSNSCNILLQDSTLVLVDGTITFGNPESKFYNNGTQYAVISCANMVIAHDVIDRIGGGPVDVHATTLTNNTGKDLRWTANVIFDGATYLPANGCRPQFGTAPKQKEPEYTLTHMAEVLPPQTERISATAIDFKDGKAFVSWHEYGDPFQGYIDVFDMSTLTINATLYSSVLDFNHITVADGQIYVAGGRNAGAFYAPVDYQSAEGTVNITLTKVNGASGNCLIKEGANIWVVSGQNGGITLFPAGSYTPLTAAKYILKYGDRIAVLAGITETKVYEYSAQTGELLDQFAVGSITPDNGKNAMATDGETLYVSLGANGMKSFKNGVETGSYSESTGNGFGAVNCVDVDDNFVYLANSNAGLVILKKSDLSVVKSYTLGGASANFVKKGTDGLIYVAYGLKGVHVFKLNELN